MNSGYREGGDVGSDIRRGEGTIVGGGPDAATARVSAEDERNREMAMTDLFAQLSAPERQLLVCALAGNHPPSLAHLRVPVLRALARVGSQLTVRQRVEIRSSSAGDSSSRRSPPDRANHTASAPAASPLPPSSKAMP
jgi:hypothetical protein